MEEEFNPPEFSYDKEKCNSFIQTLKEKEFSEIDRIITRYASFTYEVVEAALYCAVDSGYITYDQKEALTGQIRFNISARSKVAKQIKWEISNAFENYVQRYSDEILYGLIDNPSGILIDVYHAVLVKALERELISRENFEMMYSEALKQPA